MLAIILFGIFAQLSSANFKPYQPPKITIQSPIPNETYNSSSVPLNVSFAIFGLYPWALDNITSLNYTLDGQRDLQLQFAPDSGGVRFHGNSTLSGLSNGFHSVMVHGESIMNGQSIFFNESVTFTVEAPIEEDVQGNILELPPLTFSAVAVSVALAAVVATVAVGYVKRRRRFD
jgi:hypothetical protein